MNWNFRISLFLPVVFFTLFPLTSLVTAQSSQVVITPIEYPTVDRDWEWLDLLYEDQFHNYSQTIEEIMRFEQIAPDLIDVWEIGKSYQNRSIYCVRVTNELDSRQKAKSLVVAQHHGREQITVEAALLFILRTLNRYEFEKPMTEYVNSQEIYIIPTLNPDALEVVVNEGNHWLRKNLHPYDDDGDGLFDEDSLEDVDGDGHISRIYIYLKETGESFEYYEGIDNDNDSFVNEDVVGLVDLNRNYPVGGGSQEGHHDVTSEIYAGEHPFSEPETQTFRDFALKHRFAMAYSLHSGINSTFFNYDDSGIYSEYILYQNMFHDFQDIFPPWFNLYPSFPSEVEMNLQLNEDQNQLYTGVGLWREWMYSNRSTLAPITFEIFHSASVDGTGATYVIEDNETHYISEWKGIYGYFAPEEDDIIGLWFDIRFAFDYLLEMTPRLQITADKISGGTKFGDSVLIGYQVRNKSPRIWSINQIRIEEVNGSSLGSGSIIGANSTVSDSISINLPYHLQNQELYIRVGNEYTGFQHFILSQQDEKDSGYSIVDLWVIFVFPMIFYSFFVKKRTSKISKKCVKNEF